MLMQKRACLAVAVTAACVLVGCSDRATAPQSDQGHQVTVEVGEEGREHGRHMEHRFDDVDRYVKAFDDPARDAQHDFLPRQIFLIYRAS
jgi:hypothetical protein